VQGERVAADASDQEVCEGVEVGHPSPEVLPLGLDGGERLIDGLYLGGREDGHRPSPPVADVGRLGGDSRGDHPGTVALPLDRVHAEDPGRILHR